MAHPFADPLRAARALRNAGAYIADYWTYSRMPGAEPLPFSELHPCLHDRSALHDLDAHYFYVNPWAARRILDSRPRLHVDVASQTVLATMLSVTLPVMYIDYRPLTARVNEMSPVSGDLLRLPLRSDSVVSLSCLHAAEHAGLGRYGDPLDPAGTRKAAAELSRVLAREGNLFFAVPVGRQRLAFNAHRIHCPATIRDYFGGLDLVEFSAVDDDGRFRERIGLRDVDGCDYALGMFWFRKR